MSDDEELEIYATEECLERLHAAFSYVFDGEIATAATSRSPRTASTGPSGRRPHDHSSAGDPWQGRDDRIPLFTRRDPAFCLLPDAKVLSDQAKALVRGIDLLILDGLQPEAHWTHLSIGEAVDLIEELGVCRAG